MPGRLAVDFGTSNTVVALWDAQREEALPVHLADYGRRLRYRGSEGRSEALSLVPSLIHYAEDGRRWLGKQVIDRHLYGSPRTFRWMKRYIANRSPLKVRLEGREFSAAEAGADFLSAVLHAATAELDLRDEEVALTVPVEAFEHYEDWLAGVAEKAGLPRFRLIDEASAAALGYGTPIQPEDVYLIFDFGGGTLDVSIVLVEPEQARGRRCRVLGKAGSDVGGAAIDGWIFQEVLRRNSRSDADDDIRRLSGDLLVACERAKEELSSRPSALVEAGDVRAVFDQRALENLLDRHELFPQIDATIRRALNGARERGFTDEQIKAVLMVGGSSLIPSVQQLVQRIFGRQRVRLGRPLDAVARGAAAFAAGIDFFDHIQHDYAVRYLDPGKGDYEYHAIVRRGTPYPTSQPVARLTVKASHDGQTRLGIAIFEQSERRAASPVELVFDSSGAARLTRVDADQQELRDRFWVNESCPTFLDAEPPARRGEARFEVEFGIDANKRLLITARDLRTRRLALCDHPVIKLT